MTPDGSSASHCSVVGCWSSPCRPSIYWLANREFDAGRGDFFYLADAFLHGRTWLDVRARRRTT